MGCAACHCAPVRSQTRVLHENITARSQYASPDLINAIAYHGHDPADDPNWRQTGTPSQAQYARWCRQWCGMTCLQMILTHRNGTAPSLHTLVIGCQAFGGYQEQSDGSIRGLVYEPFARYVGAVHDLGAQIHRELPIAGIRDQVAAGHMVIASVHKEIRKPDLPATGKGGHLVLVTGYDGDLVHFRNPSGHTENTRTAVLSFATFAAFYAERAISIAT